MAGAASACRSPSYSVVGTYKAADGGWDILSVDPVAHRLYVGRRDRVDRRRPEVGPVTDRLAPADGGRSALAIPGTGDVLVTNGTANTATIVDGRTGQLRALFPTGKKPDAATYDPATRTVWVMTRRREHHGHRPRRRVLATVRWAARSSSAQADGHGKLYVNAGGQERRRGDRHHAPASSSAANPSPAATARPAFSTIRRRGKRCPPARTASRLSYPQRQAGRLADDRQAP